MKKNEIEIGGQYTCKVTDKIVVVKITGENLHGGWDAINLETNKKVRIKSAQRLRSARFVDQKALAEKADSRAKGAKKGKPAKAAAATPEPEAQDAAPVAAGGDPTAESTDVSTASSAADTGEAGAAGGKRMGLVSAAIQILADAGADATMNCHELVKLATERGLWQPRAGKTPAASLYAAIFREIKQRGEASRFRKTDRGKFALNKTS